MSAERTAGIDIGTSSIKAVVADPDGSIVARHRRVHRLEAPRAGRLSHDAAAVWCDGVREVWRQLASVGEIAAVTVSAMVPSMTAVGPTGRPFAPGLLYGDDRGETTVTGFGEQGELASFARWAAATHPEAAGYWPAQAVANAALCGVGAVDSIVAIMAGPLSDGAVWLADECAAIGARPDQFPVIGPGNQAIGEVDGTLVSGGTVDALAEQLVAGADAPGDVLLICGATLITWAVAEGWPEAEGLWTVPHTSGHAAIGGASNAGGLFIERVRHLVGERGDEQLASARPDRVPVWVPHIRGERVPFQDPDRRASLHDLDMGHEPGDVLRAGYEASAFTARLILERAA
ncbi:MAG: FGGY-family carbohydrate kinase, partial [Acidimicrobiia bacterium]|nr:FGGY-family carbohydrate kinase [Acidimicrobiia bacterium]